ncbi:MAG TPA: transcription elongation factor [Lacunisphaera sp.]|nr:transcription elongation factor [Lacunisphaera sp.]
MPLDLNKHDLMARIIAKLSADLEQLTSAALATHAEATDEENKAEDKYDTRGLEASYLAHGQSKAAEEAAQAVAQFQKLPIRDFPADEPISLGALVVLEGQGHSYYFIGPRAGGTEVGVDGRTVMVITPQSPLGRQLMGRKQGHALQLDQGNRLSEFRVTSVV